MRLPLVANIIPNVHLWKKPILDIGSMEKPDSKYLILLNHNGKYFKTLQNFNLHTYNYLENLKKKSS